MTTAGAQIFLPKEWLQLHLLIVTITITSTAEICITTMMSHACEVQAQESGAAAAKRLVADFSDF